MDSQIVQDRRDRIKKCGIFTCFVPVVETQSRSSPGPAEGSNDG